MEWQPVRIAPAKKIAVAHGYWPPIGVWERLQGKIIEVKRDRKGAALWDWKGVSHPIAPCAGDEFLIKNEHRFLDDFGILISSVCEHQILAD
jgi:hypothetical protein